MTRPCRLIFGTNETLIPHFRIPRRFAQKVVAVNFLKNPDTCFAGSIGIWVDQKTQTL